MGPTWSYFVSQGPQASSPRSLRSSNKLCRFSGVWGPQRGPCSSLELAASKNLHQIGFSHKSSSYIKFKCCKLVSGFIDLAAIVRNESKISLNNNILAYSWIVLGVPPFHPMESATIGVYPIFAGTHIRFFVR